MISTHAETHTSQMNTAGPAMSDSQSRIVLPQKLQAYTGRLSFGGMTTSARFTRYLSSERAAT